MVEKQIAKLIFEIWKQNQKYLLTTTKYITKRLLLVMSIVLWGRDDFHKIELFEAGLQEMLAHWPEVEGTAIQEATVFIKQHKLAQEETIQRYFLDSLNEKEMYEA